jgi:hypothetical protein
MFLQQRLYRRLLETQKRSLLEQRLYCSFLQKTRKNSSFKRVFTVFCKKDSSFNSASTFIFCKQRLPLWQRLYRVLLQT